MPPERSWFSFKPSILPPPPGGSLHFTHCPWIRAGLYFPFHADAYETPMKLNSKEQVFGRHLKSCPDSAETWTPGRCFRKRPRVGTRLSCTESAPASLPTQHPRICPLASPPTPGRWSGAQSLGGGREGESGKPAPAVSFSSPALTSQRGHGIEKLSGPGRPRSLRARREYNGMEAVRPHSPLFPSAQPGRRQQTGFYLARSTALLPRVALFQLGGLMGCG